jgi:hypothetical protein
MASFPGRTSDANFGSSPPIVGLVAESTYPVKFEPRMNSRRNTKAWAKKNQQKSKCQIGNTDRFRNRIGYEMARIIEQGVGDIALLVYYPSEFAMVICERRVRFTNEALHSSECQILSVQFSSV